jgi:hypothetical protein
MATTAAAVNVSLIDMVFSFEGYAHQDPTLEQKIPVATGYFDHSPSRRW